jgi:hypothetical protein
MSKSKQKGTAFETSLLPELCYWYPGTERRAPQGAYDKGDFNMPGAPFILEAKNHQQMSLGAWVEEAKKEMANAGLEYGGVVHKRRGVTSPGRQFVTLELGNFLALVNRPRISSP